MLCFTGITASLVPLVFNTLSTNLWLHAWRCPRLLPTSGYGWMSKTTHYFCSHQMHLHVYHFTHTPSCAFHVTKSCQLHVVTVLLFGICTHGIFFVQRLCHQCYSAYWVMFGLSLLGSLWSAVDQMEPVSCDHPQTCQLSHIACETQTSACCFCWSRIALPMPKSRWSFRYSHVWLYISH